MWLRPGRSCSMLGSRECWGNRVENWRTVRVCETLLTFSYGKIIADLRGGWGLVGLKQRPGHAG